MDQSTALMMSGPIFSLGVLREAVEGEGEDGYVAYRRYWGSLMGLGYHVPAAIACGLVTWGPVRTVSEEGYQVEVGREGDVYGIVPTEAGREFYRRHRMDSWPKGRAYMWEETDAVMGGLKEVKTLADWRRGKG